MHRRLLQRLAQGAQGAQSPSPPPSLSRARLCVHHGHRPAPFRAAQRETRPPRLPRLPFSTCAPLRREQQRGPAPPSTSTPPPSAADATALPPPRPPRRRPRWFSAAVFLLVGVLSGTLVRAVIAPPPPPVPGSPADLALQEDIRKMALKLPIVQELLANPEWTHHEAYSIFPDSARPNRITTGPLATSGAIGAYQHIFHPPASLPGAPVLDVLYLGPSTVGWPGVVHGGLLATILDEHTARAALAEPSLRAAGRAGPGGVLTARLEVTYQRPTLAGDFYVVRARALRDDELEDKERGKRHRKIWVVATLETTEGTVCVSGRALFVIPKGTELKGVADGF